MGRYNVEAWRPSCGSCLYKAALRRGVRAFTQSFGDATGTLKPYSPQTFSPSPQHPKPRYCQPKCRGNSEDGSSGEAGDEGLRVTPPVRTKLWLRVYRVSVTVVVGLGIDMLGTGATHEKLIV